MFLHSLSNSGRDEDRSTAVPWGDLGGDGEQEEAKKRNISGFRNVFELFFISLGPPAFWCRR